MPKKTGGPRVRLINAPAGYGKSRAVARLIEESSLPSIRFNLSLEHCDGVSFARGFAAAVAGAEHHPMVSFAGDGISAPAMSERLRGFHGWVAIDGFERVQADDDALRFLTELIERSTLEIQWIVATRSTARLPIGTWLASGELERPVDVTALELTLDEARLCARSDGLHLSDEEVAILYDAARGWPLAWRFAARSWQQSGDARAAAAAAQGMAFRYLDEQVYATCSLEERDLLAVASLLPSIEADVLEEAGFDRALVLLEGLAARGCFLVAEGARRFRFLALFGEFLIYRAEREGKARLHDLRRRVAHALESTGDIEAAMDAFVCAAARDETIRLLECHGFDLIDRGTVGAVSRAIETLGNVRRENPQILCLRAMLQAAAGKHARAEALYRRARSLAVSDRGLFASISLRLAILLMNLGRDAAELLDPIAGDPEHARDHRAEAISIVAVQRAVAGNETAAREYIVRLDDLLDDVEADPARARVLQRAGLALATIGEVERAARVLGEAADLAAELRLFSASSRANTVLSLLALHEDDDVVKQLHFAERALADAKRADNAFDVQASLLSMLGAEMRMGNADRSLEIESELRRCAANDSTFALYGTAHSAVRAVWAGRFEEAYRQLSMILDRFHFDFDRVRAGGQCALLLSILGRRDESIALAKETAELTGRIVLRGVQRKRAVATSKMLCSLAESLNGRFVQAEKLARSIENGPDSIANRAKALAASFAVERRRRISNGGNQLLRGAAELADVGYVDLGLLLRAVAAKLPRFGVSNGPEILTAAEIAVLRQFAEGASAKEIAMRHGRSVYTVRAHVANAIAKLGCHGRGEAVALARRNGLL